MGIEPIFDSEVWSRVPFHFWSLVFFVFGSIVGSFLNVCIHRMPLGLSIVSPPSHCPHCKYSIPWFLNLPLVTWLSLRGKCKNCAAPISPRYFLVELLTGVAFLGCWLGYGRESAWLALVYALFLAGLITASFIDFEHFIIPDELTFGGIIVGFILSMVLPALHGDAVAPGSLMKSLLGIGVGAGLVYFILRMGKLLFGRQKIELPPDAKIVFSESAVHLPDRDIPYEEIFYRQSDTIHMQVRRLELVDRCYRDVTVRLALLAKRLEIGDDQFDPEQCPHLEVVASELVLPREAMGLGDVKFMAAIGAFLGWQATIFSLMVSSMIGSVVGVTLIVLGKREWSSRLPYGPYIAAAAVVWVFAGQRILIWVFGGRPGPLEKSFEFRAIHRHHPRSLSVANVAIRTYMKRTHHCNELRPAHINDTVTLSGWVHSRRDLGGLIFIDIRDREGRTQTVFDPSDWTPELFEQAATLRSECVVSITGKVRQRPEGTNNNKIPTGEIEVMAQSFEVLNMAAVLPFPVDDPEVASKVNEELRLKYRYLDLRRPEMARNLRLRSKVATATRGYMEEQGFLEVETPILFKSTPEGAREFLVPNRREPGTFYALPQSPQQFKQMLMVAGVERYYQLARCFRDEDQRADRQLEFTQLDLEMSFIEREDIYALIEGLLQRVWKIALNVDVPTPFKRISFEEALNRYGIDKPDTRFGLDLVDFTEEFRASTFKVFSGAVANGGVVKALNAKGLAGATQGQLETMTEYAKGFGAKGLAYIKVENGEWKSPIVKFFNDVEKQALMAKLKIEEGDLILFAADQWLNACEILGKIRLYCADVLRGQGKLTIPADQFGFLWVIEFPLLGFDREQNRWYSSHHPFTAPVTEDIPLLRSDPKKVRGQHYDIVVNGVELGGGSIRIHQPAVQKTIFEELLQIPPDLVQARFGYMLEAFKYGAPPHGGIALGFDRLIAILCNTPSIRDVIAFPKTAKGTCLMTDSPSTVEPKQLRDLHIELRMEQSTSSPAPQA